MLTTPSLRSKRPRISIAGASRATLRNLAQQPFEITTLIKPVSSSRLRNVTPCAVIGRWRCVTTPATCTIEPGSGSHSCADVSTPSFVSSSRTKIVGWPSGDTPVAHKSATASSTGVMPGSRGAASPVTTPGSRPGRDWAVAPTVHSAMRRSRPKHSPNSPPVAIDSSWASVSDGTRRTRSSVSVNNPPALRTASISSANSEPIPRTDPIPNRTATSPSDDVPPEPRHGSSVAAARDALRSGVCTTTPWRRASRTSVCGDQNPIGCALSSAAQNAAGSWYLIHDDAYTR